MSGTPTVTQQVMYWAGSYPDLISNPLAICVSFFSILGTLTIGISVLPQTMETMRNRQTQTFPMLMYWFLFVGCFCLGIYGIGLVQAGYNTQAGYWSSTNTDYITKLLSDNGYITLVTGSTTTYTLTDNNTVQDAAEWLASNGKFGVVSGYSEFLISPASYAGYAVNDSTPGGMLIIGEFFASITSAIVLWIKYDNQIKAKRAGLTEAQYCEKWLAEKKLAARKVA